MSIEELAFKLAREVRASLGPVVRQEIGNSNYNAIMDLAERILSHIHEGRQDV